MCSDWPQALRSHFADNLFKMSGCLLALQPLITLLDVPNVSLLSLVACDIPVRLILGFRLVDRIKTFLHVLILNIVKAVKIILILFVDLDEQQFGKTFLFLSI